MKKYIGAHGYFRPDGEIDMRTSDDLCNSAETARTRAHVLCIGTQCPSYEHFVSVLELDFSPDGKVISQGPYRWYRWHEDWGNSHTPIPARIAQGIFDDSQIISGLVWGEPDPEKYKAVYRHASVIPDDISELETHTGDWRRCPCSSCVALRGVLYDQD